MLFLLHGPDTFRSREKLSLLKQKFLAANPEASAMTQSGDLVTPALLSELIGPSLFVSKRLIVIENLLSSKNAEEQSRLIPYLEQTDSETFIIFWEDKEIDKSAPLAKLLNQPKQAEFFDQLAAPQLAAWASAAAAHRGITLSLESARRLVELCGQDMWQIKTEILKLSGLLKTTVITPAVVNELVSTPLSVKTFDLLDAISAGNQPATLKLTHDLLQTGEDPIKLMALVSYHLRALLRVSESVAQGLTRPEIISRTKLHPFAVQKAMAQTAKLPREWLIQSFVDMAESDWLIKSGQRNPADEISRLTLHLANRT